MNEILQSDLYHSSNRNREPIAIVGIGCRFPGGACNPQKFWQLLCDGVDAIVDIPTDRWDSLKFFDSNPEKTAKMYVRQAGFLQESIFNFDASFFGISQREAMTLDPQQRLLLEVVWEAFEDAGHDVQTLHGSKTGVFIGGFCLDAKLNFLNAHNRELIHSHSATAASMTILANRISYTFDLHGPSLSIDTACSASLVATHYACQSIWNGECTAALAGGVNVMLRPEYFMVMCKGHFLSPQSRCMSFDERADGYVRGEGAGIVFLKPLSAAIRDQDPVYALIRATGVNQDGRTQGISVPNGDAQEELIRSVYNEAGISPGEVQYIEAHGTGTRVGDPIEARALNNILHQGRNHRVCWMGSVKSNIGHLEAAAGIAGLIKTALMIQKKKIPPNLHFNSPNPEIPFDDMCVRVPTRLETFDQSNGAIHAGINSFGYGGTNAHALLQSFPDSERRERIIENKRPYLVPISAKTPEACRAFALKFAQFLEENPHLPLQDIAYSASLRRSHQSSRFAILTEDINHLRDHLETFSKQERENGFVYNTVVPEEERRIVFIYTGMGPQWWGMGRELMHSEPIFRDTLENCDSIYQTFSGHSLLCEMLRDEKSTRMQDTDISQPANFFIQTALTELWRSWGIEPAAVVGHSIGEIAAAYASGAFSLQDALLVVFHRSRLQKSLSGQGAMMALGLSEEEACHLIQIMGDGISIAAVNGPASVTLSGDRTALETIAEQAAALEYFCRFLNVDIAYHSSQMDCMQTEFLSEIKLIQPQMESIPLYSTVLGKRIDGTDLISEYWWNNLRQPVRFHSALDMILNKGHRIFLEVGPHPVLTPSIQQIMKSKNIRGWTLSSLHREQPERSKLLQTLGMLYNQGFPIQWKQLLPEDVQFVKLPTYPWQKEYFWTETEASYQDRIGRAGSPFLSIQLNTPDPSFESEINLNFFPYLADHVIENQIVFPGAAYVEAAIAGAMTLHSESSWTIEEIQFHELLIVEPDKTQLLNVHIQKEDRRFEISSRYQGANAAWKTHASGKILQSQYVSKETYILTYAKNTCQDEIGVVNFYDTLHKLGYTYGPAFRCIIRLWRTDQEALAFIQNHDPVENHHVHPPTLDAAFQTFIACVSDLEQAQNQLFLPDSIERITCYSSTPETCWSYAKITGRKKRSISGDLYLLDEYGKIVLEIKGFTCKSLQSSVQDRARIDDLLYEWQWREAPLSDNEVFSEISLPEFSALVFSNEMDDRREELLSINQLSMDDNLHTLITATAKYQLNSYQKESFSLLLNSLEDSQIRNIIYLCNPANPISFTTSVSSDLIALLHLLQTHPVIISGEEVRLCIVTHDCQPFENDTIRLHQSPIIGFVRSARVEYPNVHFLLIDRQSSDEFIDYNLCIREMLHKHQNEIAYRVGKRFVHEYAKVTWNAPQEKIINVDSSEIPVELIQKNPGSFESLRFQRMERRNPGPNEIEIYVHTTALNFKDVLKALNTLSDRILDETFFGKHLGMECSGTITAIGDGVTEFKLGDEVVAFTQTGAFKSYLTSSAEYVFHKPKSLSMENAPVFTVFLTAFYALLHKAHMREGERVLIHSAAGGVGLAAVQIARWVGAEIFTTAGSDEKRRYLRDLGIHYVFDSRSLSFADEIREITSGRGVDIVLNSLTGESLYKSFNLLAPYGRFIEIGKKDIDENRSLPMRIFNRNISFISIDLDRLLLDHPQRVQQIVRQVCHAFDREKIYPLPIHTFPVQNAASAFRFMAQGKHIGKVQLQMQNQEISIEESQNRLLIRQDGSYIITGGKNGFGLELAKWLAERGARHLILLSRNPANPQAQKVIDTLRTQGVSVIDAQVDLSDEAQVKHYFESVVTSLPPLRGIFHAAMILQDTLLSEMNFVDFEQVFGPKVKGTILLHEHSRSHSLDLFVCFSSIVSCIGNIGQANYAAANSFLDGLAHYRRAQGLPCLTINWGALSEAGVISRDNRLTSYLSNAGIEGLSTEQALRVLEYALVNDSAQIGAAAINWQKWSSHHPHLANMPMFAQLIAEASEQVHARDPREQLMREITALSPSDRRDYFQELLKKEFARIMQMPVSKIQIQQDLHEMGLDSIMVVELKSILQFEYGLEISMMDLMKKTSIAQIADKILDQLQLNDKGVNMDIPNSEEETGAIVTDTIIEEDVHEQTHV